MGRVERMDALMAKYVRVQPNGCWEWMGLRVKGYGRLSVSHTKYMPAHRYAWQRVNGPIPVGLHILHKCDNPPCCNPDHLYAGTPADNARDKIERGRSNRGERNGRSKLTQAQVDELRRDHDRGLSQRALGKKFGIAQSMVSRIVTGRNWKPATAQALERAADAMDGEGQGVMPWAA